MRRPTVGVLLRFAPYAAVGAALLVYANSMANGFAFDDVHIIQENARVHDLRALRGILLTPYWPHMGTELGLYRPFVVLLYAVQWAIGGGQAWVFHAFSLLLHAAATLLAFHLLQRLTGREAALAGALLFAVHPVHTEAVSNIVGQAELVSAVAVLGAVLLHVARPDGLIVSWPRRLALAGLFAAALTTKESSVVLPALLVAADLAQHRVTISLRGARVYAGAMFMPFLLLAGVLGAYLLLRVEVLSGFLIGMDAAPALPYLSEDSRVLNAFRAFPEFARLLFVPVNLAADYAPGVILPVGSLTPMAAFGLLLLLAITVLAALTPWRPALGFPAAWFIISMAVVSNLFFPIGVLVAERTLYLPSFALSAAVAYAWAALGARPAASAAGQPSAGLAIRGDALRVAWAGLALVAILFAVRTTIRNPDWSSTSSIVAAQARDRPESYRVQWSQAEELVREGRLTEADSRFTLAYRLYPRDAQFLMSFGQFLVETGRPERAIVILEEAVGLHRTIARPPRLLAHAYLIAGRPAEAIRTVDAAVGRGVTSFVFHPVRAYSYHALGEHRRAVASWRSALDDPGVARWATTAYLARALALATDTAGAEAAIRGALELTDEADAAARLTALRHAIRTGCYAAHTRADVIGECDPLGDWFMATGHSRVPTSLHAVRSVDAQALAPGRGRPEAR
jgi:protein O-mannosyl-transferase